MSVGLLAVLIAGCGGAKEETWSVREVQASIDAQESADPSLKDVRVCTETVLARIAIGWRQAVNTEVREDAPEFARTFDSAFTVGTPEFNSYIQRWGEGLQPLMQEIAINHRDKEEAVTEQLGQVAEFVRQDCTVAYKQ
ncbi:hypothetical protein ACIQCF_33035 [Streptomyces sp. NPDC088353]|uniref:hypothetical protein n=1 Tax=Streptomyces sp. NPDC088353 TaxID=3365855 RepID=UPI00382B0F02